MKFKFSFMWGMIVGALFMTLVLIFILYHDYFDYSDDITNIKWAYDNNITPHIIIVPEKEFDSFKLDGVKVRENFIDCLYVNTTNTIFVREGSGYCLEHEYGHIRESYYGLGWHSRYAK